MKTKDVKIYITKDDRQFPTLMEAERHEVEYEHLSELREALYKVMDFCQWYQENHHHPITRMACCCGENGDECPLRPMCKILQSESTKDHIGQCLPEIKGTLYKSNKASGEISGVIF